MVKKKSATKNQFNLIQNSINRFSFLIFSSPNSPVYIFPPSVILFNYNYLSISSCVCVYVFLTLVFLFMYSFSKNIGQAFF